MGIREACRCGGNGTWQSQSERVLCRFQKTRVRPVLLCGEVCYGTAVPENVTKLVNATTRRRGGVHFPTRWCPATLAYGCPEVPQSKPTRSIDWSCISRRQHLHMATPVTGPDSVWFCDFFHWGFVKDNVYYPHFRRRFRNCEDSSAIPSRMSQKTWLRGFGENESSTWTSAASHVVRTSNALKVITKLQTFLFQMPVVSCICVYYY
jgi:hypothetical protein